jgi:rhodanese-related sulfurtransferase
LVTQGRVKPPGAKTIDEVLAGARARLSRLSPVQAQNAAATGAVLVDIRPQAQRLAEGEIPDALIIERNVLEWRLDPLSAARLPAASYDLQIVVFCSEGYTSSLAAASLLDLGLRRATDLAGGFRAWQAAGLPVTTPARHDSTRCPNSSDGSLRCLPEAAPV